MPYKPRQVKAKLTAKLGMTVSNKDHTWLELRLNGLPPIRTKLPNHKEDIGPKLESRICNQLRIRKPLFCGLMDCTKYLQDYEKQVREDPYPPFNVPLV